MTDEENERERATAQKIGNLFEGAAEKLKATGAVTDAQIGFALLGVATAYLSRAEPPEAIVARLINMTDTVAEMLGVNVETSERLSGPETTRQ